MISSFQPLNIDRQQYRSTAPGASRKWLEVIESLLVPIQAHKEADKMQSKASDGCIAGPFPDSFFRD